MVSPVINSKSTLLPGRHLCSAPDGCGCSALQALEENGGAVDIAAGSTFCLARTGNGRAVLWGGLQGAGNAGSTFTGGSKVAVAEVMGVPPILHIAAGHSHTLMSDGEHVWALGQCASHADHAFAHALSRAALGASGCWCVLYFLSVSTAAACFKDTGYIGYPSSG